MAYGSKAVVLMINEPDFEFTVPGTPMPWKRAGRDGRSGRTFTPAKMKQRKGDVRIIGGAAMRSRGFRIAPEGVPVLISVEAYFKMPKPSSLTKAEYRRRMDGVYHCQVPDADNITKLIKDALNQVCWADDCQAQIMGSVKYWCEGNPRTVVKIKGLPHGR